MISENKCAEEGCYNMARWCSKEMDIVKEKGKQQAIDELKKQLIKLPDCNQVYNEGTEEYDFVLIKLSYCCKHNGFFDEDEFKNHYDCQDEIPFQRITIAAQAWFEFLEKLKERNK